MKETSGDARKTLVNLLREAAQLEHCLLNTYLYAACSIKSLPYEFAVATPLEKPNLRRAIQFERARAWKQSLLLVAHEEMLHLHYVQCLLRALGERPYFGLPSRNQAGNWTIENWKAQIGSEPVGGDGVDIPVERLTLDTIRRFVVYESTDAVQDNDPFGPSITALFEKLAAFEQELKLASIVMYVSDPTASKTIHDQLSQLYSTLSPVEMAAEALAEDTRAVKALPPVKSITFQSIGDFYMKGILPLYEQAFEMGWVKHTNRDLNNELQDPNYAAEGFLPIGPIPRTQRFQKQSTANSTNPIRNYKSVRSIVEEIVEEGEGFSKFDTRAQKWLAEVAKIGGAPAYLKLLMSRKPSPITDEGEQLRQSHLYRFSIILSQMKQEESLAQKAGVDFTPSRIPVDTSGSVAISKVVSELPLWFNSCYTVMLAWLGRIYETHDWHGDKSRRQAIEMLASWPLMSLAIRPFLELASFLDIDRSKLFCTDAKSLPILPLNAIQLHSLLEKPATCQADEDQIDYFAVRALKDAAEWAADSLAAVKESDLFAPETRMMIETRLSALTMLSEFEKQFPFRQHGGYSNRLPDLTYTQNHPDGDLYTENPSSFQNGFLNQSLALRLRFTGRGLVQLSTDPDPPTDEAGCTGTHMLHPADGLNTFNRYLVWQPSQTPNAIVRDPVKQLLPLGVECVEAAVMIAPQQASAGYLPLQVMSSTGAVQTSGLQQKLTVSGLQELVSFPVDSLLTSGQSVGVQLLPKDGNVPHLLGENHLVWQDGEPIDPFIFSVGLSDNGTHTPCLTREVFNDGLSMLEMNPLQRTLSSRSPCGFDFDLSSIPNWAVTPELEQAMNNPAYPMSYLQSRAKLLAGELISLLPPTNPTIDLVDQVISYAERIQLVTVPRGTTVGWLGVLLHYGHTLSGPIQAAAGNPLIAALSSKLNLQLDIPADSGRGKSNSSWLLDYTLGLMDTDALSCQVYGELYVPLVASSTDLVTLQKTWDFSPEMNAAVAALALNFAKPFWDNYQVNGTVRTLSLNGSTLTETLLDQSAAGYAYSQTGIAGTSTTEGRFDLQSDSSNCRLTWSYKFLASDSGSLMNAITYFSNAVAQMQSAMTTSFLPK